MVGNDVEPDPAEKNQPSGKNPSDPSDVNDSIDLFGNNVKPDHNLKICSTQATNNIDNPGKKSVEKKNSWTHFKSNFSNVIGNKGLPEENQSNYPCWKLIKMQVESYKKNKFK